MDQGCPLRNPCRCGTVLWAPEECPLNKPVTNHLQKLQINLLVSLLPSHNEMFVMILDPKETWSAWIAKSLRGPKEALQGVVQINEALRTVCSEAFFVFCLQYQFSGSLHFCLILNFHQISVFGLILPFGLISDNL